MAIYAIAGGGFIKVGFTTGDPDERMAALQVGNPHDLRLIGVSGGELGDEERVHKLLAPFWVRGEWFVDCPVARALILRLLPMACPRCRNVCSFLSPRYPDTPDLTSSRAA